MPLIIYQSQKPQSANANIGKRPKKMRSVLNF